MSKESKSPLVPEVVEDNDSGMAVIRAQSSAAIEVAVRAANTYPRSIVQFRADVLDMATVDEETAAECFYTKPVGNGSTAEGPSVRLAEIILATYGHIMVEARIIDEDRQKGTITAQGKAWDMQKNSWSTAEVSKSIKKRNGGLYSDPQIEVAKSALCSIAKRNAILGVVPKALIKKQLDGIRKVARGDEKTLGTRMNAMLEFFKKQGVKPAEICSFCNKSDSTELDADDLVRLKGLVNSVKDGDYPGYKEAFKDMGVEIQSDNPLAPGKHRPEKDKTEDIEPEGTEPNPVEDKGLEVDTSEDIPEGVFDGKDPLDDVGINRRKDIETVMELAPDEFTIEELLEMPGKEVADLRKKLKNGSETPVEAPETENEATDTTEDDSDAPAGKKQLLQALSKAVRDANFNEEMIVQAMKKQDYFKDMAPATLKSYASDPSGADIEDIDCMVTAVKSYHAMLNG